MRSVPILASRYREGVTDAQLLLRLLVALGLSGLLGVERESRGKAAGLRTHALVGVSSALFVVLGEVLMLRATAMNLPALKLDPLAILGAVVSGVSFLGAGTIFISSSHDRPHGLTSAASLLAAAAIGLSCGLERYGLALGATAMYLFVLFGLRTLEHALEPKKK